MSQGAELSQPPGMQLPAARTLPGPDAKWAPRMEARDVYGWTGWSQMGFSITMGCCDFLLPLQGTDLDLP